ncbi:MAG: protein kinase [Verrucomicrobiales bacterium]|nr:protein kinase [Verrucomicrobiales bacterium]
MSSQPIASNSTCIRCGTLLAVGEVDGQCPRCLSQLLFQSAPGAEPAATGRGDLRRLGDYELLEEIARGGMGIVFRARQISLNRTVAVKLMRDSALAGAEEVRRFRVEAGAAAKLKHPNIVAIYEVGDHDGQHYFAMDLVEGPNLAQRVRENPLPPREAACLVATIAEAVQHAHERGVLHRDLKPSNVLMDVDGRPYVTDFGLARSLEGDSSLTLTGQILGTPGYMPPEQATGQGSIGPAADIYSLGAVLYYLLTSRAPFVGGTPTETLRHVVEQEPVPPHLVNPEVPRDLESVCLKCLSKRPSDRYPSAADLGADLRRFERGEPTHARPAGNTERLWRWCQRKPALSTAIGCAVILGVVGVAGILWQWQRADAERTLARQNELLARQGLYAADMNLVQQTLAQQNLSGARELLHSHEPRAGQTDLRGWEWWYYSKLCQGDETLILDTNGPSIAFSVALRRQNLLALRRADGSSELRDLVTGVIIHDLGQDELGRESGMAAAADGSILGSSSGQGMVRLWDLSDRSRMEPVGALRAGRLISISSKRRLIATAPLRQAPFDIPGNDAVNTVVWNYETAAKVATLAESGDYSLFSRDGGTLVTGSWLGSATIWDTQSWKARHRLPATGNITAMALSPDDRLLVTCSWEGSVILWDVVSGHRLGEFKGHSSRVWAVDFSPDGSILATGSGDQTIALWDVASRQELRRLRGHDSELRRLSFSSDGGWLASTENSSPAPRIWRIEGFRNPSPTLRCLAPPVFSPDGRVVAAGDQTGVTLWDVRSLTSKATLRCEPNPVGFSSDGKLLITATVPTPLPTVPGPLTGLKFWDVGSLSLRDTISFSSTNGIASAVALSPRGDLLASGDPAGDVILWDTQSGAMRSRLARASRYVWNLMFSRDGAMLAVGSGGNIRLWRLGAEMKFLDFEASGLPLAISPDGHALAVGMYKEIGLFDTDTGKRLRTLRGHREGLYWLSFSEDGRTLASACEDIKLWNLATGREVGSLRGEAPFLFVRFSPEGQSLLGGRMGQAYVWSAAAKLKAP